MDVHYAEDYSLIMGIVDFIPVILFALAGCILIKVLFNVLKKPFAVLFSSGVTLALIAGTFKATWKVLVSLNICDFYPFNVMFMPTQSLAFILMGVGLLSMLFDKDIRNPAKVNVVVWPLVILLVLERAPVKMVDGNIAFIAMLVIGEIMIATALCFLAVKNKNWLCLALFIVSFICLMVMGAMKPLSTKLGLTVTASNWIEQSINTVGQITLLLGCYFMNKKGFFSYKENAPVE